MDPSTDLIVGIFLFTIGTVFGSFLNVLSDRLPNDETIMGRSHCDFCKKTLQPHDLIPVFSYLFQKGRCRYCKKKLSAVYPFIEILTGLVFVTTWFTLGTGTLEKFIYLVIMSILLVIIFADAKYQIIPDSMQVGLLLAGLALHYSQGSSAQALWSFVLSGFAVLGPILFLFLVTKGRGMGFGDVKLAYVIGFLLGWEGGLMALYVAFLTGALVGGILLVKGRKGLKSKIAFGPFLVIGISTVIFFHDPLFSLVSNFTK